jgi:hypothetical protein
VCYPRLTKCCHTYSFVLQVTATERAETWDGPLHLCSVGMTRLLLDCCREVNSNQAGRWLRLWIVLGSPISSVQCKKSSSSDHGSNPQPPEPSITRKTTTLISFPVGHQDIANTTNPFRAKDKVIAIAEFVTTPSKKRRLVWMALAPVATVRVLGNSNAKHTNKAVYRLR